MIFYAIIYIFNITYILCIINIDYIFGSRSKTNYVIIIVILKILISLYNILRKSTIILIIYILGDLRSINIKVVMYNKYYFVGDNNYIPNHIKYYIKKI